MGPWWAWDINNISTTHEASLSLGAGAAWNWCWSTHGVYLFYNKDTNPATLGRRTCSVPWDIGTAGAEDQASCPSGSNEVGYVGGPIFNLSGTEVNCLNEVNETWPTWEFVLSTPWDLTSYTRSVGNSFPFIAPTLDREKGDRWINFNPYEPLQMTQQFTVGYDDLTWSSQSGQKNLTNGAGVWVDAEFRPDGKVCMLASTNSVVTNVIIAERDMTTDYDISDWPQFTTATRTRNWTVNGRVGHKWNWNGTKYYAASVSGVLYQYSVDPP